MAQKQAAQHQYDWSACQHRMYQNDWHVGEVWGANDFQLGSLPLDA